MLTILLLLVLCYLLGSIPTSLLIGKILRGIDIRDHGSGNAGASNVLRTIGAAPAAFVLAVDLAKGFTAVELGRRLWLDPSPVAEEWAPLATGLAAIIGHVWPVFAAFRGGKGVAAAAGVVLALDPLLLAVSVTVFVVLVAATRRIAVGSIAAAVTLPVALFLMRAAWSVPVATSWLGFCLMLALLIAYTHRSNILRLIAGTESRL